MNNVNMLLMNITEIADRAVELAREAGRKEALDDCLRALRFELNSDSDGLFADGLEYAIEVIEEIK